MNHQEPHWGINIETVVDLEYMAGHTTVPLRGMGRCLLHGPQVRQYVAQTNTIPYYFL